MVCHPLPFGATPMLRSHSAPKPRTGWSPVEHIVYGRMCKSFLGCVLLDPTKSENKGTTLLYRRFPPTTGLSEFRASSPKIRERQVDAGEAPTQRVMGFGGIYNSNYPFTHMVCHPLPFGATPILCSQSTPKPQTGWSLVKRIRLWQIPEPVGV